MSKSIPSIDTQKSIAIGDSLAPESILADDARIAGFAKGSTEEIDLRAVAQAPDSQPTIDLPPGTVGPSESIIKSKTSAPPNQGSKSSVGGTSSTRRLAASKSKNTNRYLFGLAMGTSMIFVVSLFLFRETHKDPTTPEIQRPESKKPQDASGSADVQSLNSAKATESAKKVVVGKGVMDKEPRVGIAPDPEAKPIVRNDEKPKTEQVKSGLELLKAPFTKAQAEMARAAWAAHLGIAERKEKLLPNGVKLELVLIPPGKFKMGTPGNDKFEVQHEVTITRPFYLAVTETTQEQYVAVTGVNPSWFSPLGQGKALADRDTAKFPVDTVSWHDADRYCKQIGAQLPTEAQWEYACRAGSETAFHVGETLAEKDANTDSSHTTKVASFKPNSFELFDMHGNVWEWCRDSFAPVHTEKSDESERGQQQPATDPDGLRVGRGGSWLNSSKFCRSAYRNGYAPDQRKNFSGFRVVMLP